MRKFAMQLSQSGLEFIAGFEGYHRALPNGDCTTYYCPAHVLTIGYGCTEGITEGMVWTKDQAMEAFRKELGKHEKAVERLTTVDLNQNQYDALVSFSYNCGSGALSKSTLLKKVNAGDFSGASREFAKWNKGGGRVLPGLVRRRADEAAMFMRPAAPSTEPDMPQQVDPPSDAPEGSRKIAVANAGQTAAATGAVGLASLSISDSLGYATQAATFVKTYGVQMAVSFLVIALVAFAAIKWFTRQDFADGRYLPSRGVK